MKISVTDAKGQLTELVRRAEEGEDIVLTRHGHEIVQLVPVKRPVDRAGLRQFIEAIQADAAAKAIPGPDAAHSQDFLYGDDGLPK